MRKAWALSLMGAASMAFGAGVGSVERVDPALDKLVPKGAEIEKIAGGFIFTEGPLWFDADGGYLLFSDVPGNVISKWTPSGKVTPFRKPVFAGKVPQGAFLGSNGLIHDSQGRLIACEHGNRRVSRTEKDGKITVLADKFEGKRFNSPNDAVYKSNGDLYFTDPPYGFADQDHDPARELPYNGVFRLTPTGKIDVLVKDLTRPNGIAFSPDEKKMYISNSDPNNKRFWMVYDVKADGTLANGKEFYNVSKEKAEENPDGLKVDTAGNVYATGPGGVWIFSPAGKVLGKIMPPEVPANCAFGDKDRKTLYMTARTGVYRIKLNSTGNKP